VSITPDDLFTHALDLARLQWCPDRPLDPPEERPERDFGDRCDEAYEARVARELDQAELDRLLILRDCYRDALRLIYRPKLDAAELRLRAALEEDRTDRIDDCTAEVEHWRHVVRVIGEELNR
jgi:hypothetical protein